MAVLGCADFSPGSQRRLHRQVNHQVDLTLGGTAAKMEVVRCFETEQDFQAKRPGFRPNPFPKSLPEVRRAAKIAFTDLLQVRDPFSPFYGMDKLALPKAVNIIEGCRTLYSYVGEQLPIVVKAATGANFFAYNASDMKRKNRHSKGSRA